jgi:hypothetical protein
MCGTDGQRSSEDLNSEGRRVKNKFISLALVALLAACSGGNPFDEAETDGTGGTDPEAGVVSTGILRDGISPSDSGLVRAEPSSTGLQVGNGFATGIAYNSADDTFSVDNLAFDGDRPYGRVDDNGDPNVVTSLSFDANGRGRFDVYEGPQTAIDPRSISDANPTGEVRQFQYRAIYGVSDNTYQAANGQAAPTTQFAIVRTGTYTDYGFGGFIYQRNTDANLPQSGSAVFSGHSAGLRDFGNQTGLQYTTSDVLVVVDFADFNATDTSVGNALGGAITNRQVYDLNGNNITAAVAGELGAGITTIPDGNFDIGPGVFDNEGAIVTNISSKLPDGTPDGTPYETGTFYAIVSGDADEIVGVFVLESEGQSVSSRDTSGFIVYRGGGG